MTKIPDPPFPPEAALMAALGCPIPLDHRGEDHDARALTDSQRRELGLCLMAWLDQKGYGSTAELIRQALDKRWPGFFRHELPHPEIDKGTVLLVESMAVLDDWTDWEVEVLERLAKSRLRVEYN